MQEHDSRCEGPSDEKLLDDVKRYGWHVVKVLDTADSPGWAYSVGLYQTFRHPEIIIFGLDLDDMHVIINTIGETVREGHAFENDRQYPNLVEDYACQFKSVNVIWYYPFLVSASWFYQDLDYPVLQCFWPDKNSSYPWEADFERKLLESQPLLFNDNPTSARTIELLKTMSLESE
jgi:Domain of unknown function (DUF4262)